MLNSPLNNLVFFNDNGLQLKLDKTYNLLWAIGQDISDPLIKIDSEISGYVFGDEYTGLGSSRNGQSAGKLSFHVLNQGCIKFNKSIISEYNTKTKKWEDNSFFDGSLQTLKKYKDDFIKKGVDEKLAEEQARIKYIKLNLGVWITNFTFFPYINNSVIDSLDFWQIRNNALEVLGKDGEVKTIESIYDFDDASTSIIKDIDLVERKFYQDDDENADYYEYYVKGIEVSDVYNEILNNWLDDCVKNKISKSQDNLYSLFPFMSYVGTLNQEKVSADLVASNTLFILGGSEENEDKLIRPYGESYNLCFAFGKDSQCKFIESDLENNEVKWKTVLDLKLPVKPKKNNSIDEDKLNEENLTPKPLSFSIGFLADEEGVYQNSLHIYLRSKSNSSILYNFGVINVKTEVEGEDERYRTLFNNFGIPDPITYPNLFKEKDPDEELIDYELVNKKSKELFLSYNDIFPYVGTYKALINAVKFLGYDDVFFREWYKIIKNENTHSPYSEVSYQSIDMDSKKTLESKLKSINVSYEEFLNYKKLNKLSLVYYFNKIDEDSEYDTVKYKVSETKFFPELERKEDQGKQKELNYSHEKIVEMPSTFRVYDYTGDALLAKLLSLKKWLEKYIIGINCHIADVTGEGVYFYRVENYAYHTKYQLLDYKKEGFLTPNFVDSEAGTRMVNSSANIRCSLNEFNSLKFSDYSKTPIKSFVRKIADFGTGKYYVGESFVNEYKPKYTFIEPQILVSNPLEAVVPYNELSYVVNASSNVGSLYEQFSSEDQQDQNIIYVNNGRIVNYNEYGKTASFKNLPIIDIELANIRDDDYAWPNNIVYTIKSVIDQNTGELFYQVKDVRNTDSEVKYLSSHFILIPDQDPESDQKPDQEPKIKPELKYSEENVYSLPLFMFKNYKFYKDGSVNTYFKKDKDYILEILDGKFLFDNLLVEGTKDEYIGQELQFIRHKIQNEGALNSPDYDKTQDIGSLELSINTTYESSRQYIYKFEPFYDADDSNNDGSKIIKLFNDLYKKASSLTELMVGSDDFNIFMRSKLHDYVQTRVDEILGKHNGIPTAIDFNGAFNNNNLFINFIKPRLMQNANISEKAALDFLFDEELEEYKRFLWRTYVKSARKQAYEVFIKNLKSDEYYHFNRYTDIKVNRIGKYSLMANAYDGFNNVYSSMAGNTENVYGLSQVIDTFVNSEYSNFGLKDKTKTKFSEVYKGVKSNSPQFFKNDQLPKSKNPIFPRAYRIYDLNIDNDTISFDNISYATNIDTLASENHYVYLNNFTEKVRAIDTKGVIYLFMPYRHFYDPNKVQKLLINTSTMDSQSVGLIIYDDVLKKMDSEIYIKNMLKGGVVFNMTYNVKELLNDAAKSSTKSIYIIQSDYAKVLNAHDNTVYIDKDLFNIGDVIKLSYVYPENDELDGFTYDDIISQEALRVIDKTFNKSSNQWCFTLSNHYNVLKDVLNCDLYISRGNTKYVNYELNVKSENIKNQVVENNLNDSVEYKTIINYNYKDWFASDYLDNSYSMYCLDYNPLNIYSDWVDYDELVNKRASRAEEPTSTAFPPTPPAGEETTTTEPSTAEPPQLYDWKDDMYKFQNKTLVLGQNKNVVLTSEDVYSTFGGKYKSLWNVYVDSIEELDWKYGSIINDVVFIKTNVLGENTWKLTTIDKFGNTIDVQTSQKLLVHSED